MDAPPAGAFGARGSSAINKDDKTIYEHYEAIYGVVVYLFNVSVTLCKTEKRISNSGSLKLALINT